MSANKPAAGSGTARAATAAAATAASSQRAQHAVSLRPSEAIRPRPINLEQIQIACPDCRRPLKITEAAVEGYTLFIEAFCPKEEHVVEPTQYTRFPLTLVQGCGRYQYLAFTPTAWTGTATGTSVFEREPKLCLACRKDMGEEDRVDAERKRRGIQVASPEAAAAPRAPLQPDARRI